MWKSKSFPDWIAKGAIAIGIINATMNDFRRFPRAKVGSGKRKAPAIRAAIVLRIATLPEYFLLNKPNRVGKTAATQIKSATRNRYNTLYPFDATRIAIPARTRVKARAAPISFALLT